MNLIIGVCLFAIMFVSGYYAEKLIKKIDNLLISNQEEKNNLIKLFRRTFSFIFINSIIITILVILKDLFF